MSIPHRRADLQQIISAARTFFVSSSISGKRSLLQSDRAAQLFIQVLYEYRGQGKFRLHQFVVMPDHFHVLITVGRNMTIERAVQFIKGGFAFRAGRELGFQAPVWQKGFSEVRILDREALKSVRTYIHNNPVAAHLVGQASEFQFSSAHAGFQLDPVPLGLKPVVSSAAVGSAEALP